MAKNDNPMLQPGFDKKKDEFAEPAVRAIRWECPSDIGFSPFNPRKGRNPNYDSIRQSILQEGRYDEPIEISRHPETRELVIYRSGNTRLEIAQEALAAGDERFELVECRYVPYESDLHSAAQNYNSNADRGEMTFIEKALHVNWLQSRINHEAGVELTQAAMMKELQAYKVNISRKMLRNYFLAAKYYAYLPMAFDGGAGQPFADGLHKLELAIEHIFNDSEGCDSIAPLSELLEVLANSLKLIDRSEGLRLAEVEEFLVQELAKKLDMEVFAFDRLFQAAKAGEDIKPYLPSDGDGSESQDVPANESTTQEGEGSFSDSEVERVEEQLPMPVVSGDGDLMGSDNSDYDAVPTSDFQDGGSDSDLEEMSELAVSIPDPMKPVAADDMPSNELSWEAAKQMLLDMGQKEEYRVLTQAADVLAGVNTADELDLIIGAAVAKKRELQEGEA